MWDSPDERSQSSERGASSPQGDSKHEGGANGDAVKPKPNLADITP